MRASGTQVSERVAAIARPGGPPAAALRAAEAASTSLPGAGAAPEAPPAVPLDAAQRTGWVPSPPSRAVRAVDHDSDPEAPASGADLRARALTAAMTAYTAAHGHPVEADALEPPRRRWGLSGRSAVVGAAALLAVVGVVVSVAAARGAQTTPSVVVQAAAGASASPPPVGPEVVVHVVGEVAQPGLVRLPEGSRVADAVDAAGGATAAAELAALNLARVLVDGEQLVVPGPAAAAVQGAAVPETDAGLVDLNAADAAALDGLPGIGPVLAQRIVDWRTEHGRFSVVDELAEVTGIGPALLDGVRDLVRIG